MFWGFWTNNFWALDEQFFFFCPVCFGAFEQYGIYLKAFFLHIHPFAGIFPVRFRDLDNFCGRVLFILLET